MDILNPYGDEHRETPGEQYQRIAGEVVKFVEAVGGPKLNQDAVSVVLGDVLAWLRRLQ